MTGSPIIDALLLAFGFACSLLVFVPLPGISQLPTPIRSVFALAIACCLLPFWLARAGSVTSATFVGSLLKDCTAGLMVGLGVSLLSEILIIGAQQVANQAGFTYATTIDPTNQVDTGTLQVLAQMLGGMLFFALRLDHQFLRALAHYAVQTTSAPDDAFLPLALDLLRSAFQTALQLSMPVTALLFLVDLSLAFLGRVQTQLQLLPLALPLKVLAAMLMLASLYRYVPVVQLHAAQATLQAISRLLGGA